jgi:hypothetical protein
VSEDFTVDATKAGPKRAAYAQVLVFHDLGQVGTFIAL